MAYLADLAVVVVVVVVVIIIIIIIIILLLLLYYATDKAAKHIQNSKYASSPGNKAYYAELALLP